MNTDKKKHQCRKEKSMKLRVLLFTFFVILICFYSIMSISCQRLLYKCIQEKTTYADVSDYITTERCFSWIHDDIGLNTSWYLNEEKECSFSMPLLCVSTDGFFFATRYSHFHGSNNAGAKDVPLKLYIQFVLPCRWQIYNIWEAL